MVTGHGEAIRRSRIWSLGVLGCGFDGDGVSEGLEFSDESAGFFGGVCSAVEVESIRLQHNAFQLPARSDAHMSTRLSQEL
jgi:hypothetical protein